MKKIVMTGSPKSAGFKTKTTFLAQLSEFNFEDGKKFKKNNSSGIDILVTDDILSDTTKMRDAKEYGVEIMTYEELVDTFDLEPDI